MPDGTSGVQHLRCMFRKQKVHIFRKKEKKTGVDTLQ